MVSWLVELGGATDKWRGEAPGDADEEKAENVVDQRRGGGWWWRR